MPALAGNTVELLADYVSAVDRIVSDIDDAQRHVEYFMFADDRIGERVIDALIRAHKRGVVCRVPIDHLGNFSFNRPVLERLRAAGVPVQQMLPMRPFDNQWFRLSFANLAAGVV
jgi:cardiolipin synthase